MKEKQKDYTKTLGLFIIAILGTIYLFYTYTSTKKDHDYNALQISKTAAATLPVKELKKLGVVAADVNKPEYKLIENGLRSILEVNSKAKFTYLYTVKNGQICLMADFRPTNSLH